MCADIAKCKGTDCPLRKQCLRYTVPPDKYYQSWFVKVPYDFMKKECEYGIIKKSN